MSLPLTRRIAKAALLTAAGAASVVGAAGSASAIDLQQANDLGGLSNLDTAGVTEATGSTVGTAAELAGEVGGDALEGGMPTGRLVSDAGESVTPLAEHAVADTTETVNGELGQTAHRAADDLLVDDLRGGGLPGGDLTGDLVSGDVLGGGLPTEGLTGGLPTGGLTGGLPLGGGLLG
jgi:hypothetical protein